MRFATIFAALTLAACSNSREIAGDFDLVDQGQVKREHVPAFTECVNAAFKDRTTMTGVLLKHRQQQRDGLLRVEVTSSSVGSVLSADIYHDGRYELYVTRLGSSIYVTEETSDFKACAQKYR